MERQSTTRLNNPPWTLSAWNHVTRHESHYVRLSPQALTGQQFKVNAPDVWNTRINDQRSASFE